LDDDVADGLPRVDPDGLVGLRAWVEGFWTDALARFKTLAEEDPS